MAARTSAGDASTRVNPFVSKPGGYSAKGTGDTSLEPLSTHHCEASEPANDEEIRSGDGGLPTLPPEPPLATGGEFDLAGDPRYAGIAIPDTESLKDTIARVLPYYEATIAPMLAAGETVIVAAHGNSLRALVKHLSGISDADITGLEIPTGAPIIYELDDTLAATDRYYLAER